MAINKWPGRSVLIAVATIAIAGAVSIGGFSKVTHQKPKTEVMPEVISRIKNLEVVKATIVDSGTPAAGVRIEIRNNSHKAVMAVDLVSGEGAITTDGTIDEEHPLVVIEPYGTTTLEMTFSEMTPGSPLVVSAVTYADGTEEGEAASLRIMHKIREREKAKIRAERENHEGGTKP